MILSDSSTWPSEIFNVLKAKKVALCQEHNNELEYINTNSLFIKRPTSPVTDKVINQLISILEVTPIRCYHCTRLEKASLKDGVKVLDAESHIEYCLEILRKKISSSVYKKLKYQYKSMLSDGFFNNRSGQLHFVLSKELTRDSGCVGLYKYYGGEALRRIIEYAKLSDQVLPVLNRIGEPMVIEFDLLGIEIRRFGLWCIAEHLLKTIFKDENKHIIFLCEAFITHSMARKDIMGYWTMVKYW